MRDGSLYDFELIDMERAVQKCAAFFFGARTAAWAYIATSWVWAIKGGESRILVPAYAGTTVFGCKRPVQMSRVIPSSKRHFPRESRVINIAARFA